ncbi:MAG: copper-translocating P-type ATPase, partial [Acinetobacter sp.]|nr:copper-translocating P-type ATPase [Acinetobacter sp.]
QQLQQQQTQEIQQLKYRTLWAFALSLPVFILEMGGHFFPALHHAIAHVFPTPQLWYVQAFLTVLLLCTAGKSFYTQGLAALWRRMPDMNSLVAVGTLAALLYSLVATFVPHWLPSQSVHVYYEATMMIISLVLAGRYIESRAKAKVSDALGLMLNLQAKTARVLQQGAWVDVDIDDVYIGDEIDIRPGEKIPVDGVVLSGESYVNEAMMTGEAMPVHKTMHSTVMAGTINQQGHLHIQAQSVGQDTVFAQMLQLIEQAQSHKLPVQQLVDRITRYFVPMIFALALLSLLAWLIFAPHYGINTAIVHAVSVLIVACPCAMGLATPVSIMLALTRGAELGILLRRGDALQQLHKAKVIAFDKTGTLTEARPTLQDHIILDHAYTWQDILQITASIEHKSEHPLAQAFTEKATQQQIPLLDVQHFHAHIGYGVRAELDFFQQMQTFHIGSFAYMQQLNVTLQGDMLHYLDDWASQGYTPLLLATSQRVIALFAISDRIQPTAFATVQQLQQHGYTLAMLTGDQQQTAQAVAQQLHIPIVMAQLLPQQKVHAIQQLQQQYGTVIFVGDGINDAPALATADVGIAIGSGTDIAMETADVVIMASSLSRIMTALHLSQATMRNIYQNLFWAFIYNIILIPVAMGVFYVGFGVSLSPMLAAVAMACSSIFVLMNALRLRSMKFS